MLDKLLGFLTYEETLRLSVELKDSRKMVDLFSQIADHAVVLNAEDLWSDRALDANMVDEAAVERTLSATRSEPIGCRILHRLQILANLNLSISAEINSYLRRACV